MCLKNKSNMAFNDLIKTVSSIVATKFSLYHWWILTTDVSQSSSAAVDHSPDSKVHVAHLGPVGPRWAPCWSHEPCYQGIYLSHLVSKAPRGAAYNHRLTQMGLEH